MGGKVGVEIENMHEIYISQIKWEGGLIMDKKNGRKNGSGNI